MGSRIEISPSHNTTYMDSLKRGIESFLLEKLGGRPPSASYAVVWRDGEKLIGAVGYRDVEEGLPATPETLYGVGSITKTFTALTVLMLHREGMLSLDDPISRYVAIDMEIGGEEVMIWHLLSHTSGVAALAYAESLLRGYVGESPSYLPISGPEDILSFMEGWRDWALAWPGEKYFYLNEGFVLVGLAIEKATGMRYEDALRKYVLERLGMDSTTIGRPRDKGLMATPYVVGREGLRRARIPPLGADGGMITNAVDMSRFLMAMLNRGGDSLPRDVVEELEKPRIRTSLLNREEYYCLGLSKTVIGGLELYGHSGSVLVYTAYMAYNRDEGVGVAVMSNGTGYPMSSAGLYILARALGRNPLEFEPLLIDEALNSLVGTYESFKGGFRARVERMGGILILKYSGRSYEVSIPLIPRDVSGDEKIFEAISGDRRYEAVFYKRDGEQYLQVERYLFRRVPA